MTFFSDSTDHTSHRVRIVLAEKGVTVDIVDCDPDDLPEEVSEINPYNNLPTLFDRDLVLYEPNITTDKKIGDLGSIAMPSKGAAEWFGAPPPDLTLVARKRSPDWVYTYLKTFYVDPSRPLGVNNKVFPKVGMPHVLEPLQGVQRTVCKEAPIRVNGSVQTDPISGQPLTENQCGILEVVDGTGQLTPAEYDQLIYDLVNFLEYVGEPSKAKSHDLGIYVLLFLMIFFVFAYLLKREYWKDVH
jgi:ubiquinol-cytochrome c reductase cytochrome c1 subunit